MSFAWAKKKIVGFADTSKQAESSRATSAKADSPDTRGKKTALPHVRPKHSLTAMVQWATVAFRASRGDDGTPQRHVLGDRKSEHWLDEDSFRDTWEFLPLGMLILDDHGDILKANRRTEHLFGYRRRDLVGTPVSRLVPELAENGWSAYREKFLPASQTVSPVSAHGLIARRKDGSEFPVDVSLRSPSNKKKSGGSRARRG